MGRQSLPQGLKKVVPTSHRPLCLAEASVAQGAGSWPSRVGESLHQMQRSYLHAVRFCRIQVDDLKILLAPKA